jgi:preprotein translocase subunit SecG
MYIAVAIIHVIVSLFLIIVVLLQSGKAADIAGAFGGLGSQTVFGPRGSATVLTRATTASAIIFMVTSLTLSILSTGNSTVAPVNSILDEISAPADTKAVPATDATKDATKAAEPDVLNVLKNIGGKDASKANEIEVQVPAPAPAK